MGANSQFHKVIGIIEVAAGAVLDYYGQGWIGNPLILNGINTFNGIPGAAPPAPAAVQVNTSSAIAPNMILYGETRVGGILVAADSGDGGGSTDADYKYYAVVHSLTLKNTHTSPATALPVHGVSNVLGVVGDDVLGIDGYWIDENNITGPCVQSDFSLLNTGSNGNLINYDGLVWIRTYLGDQTAADGWLTAGLSYWLSTAVLKGNAYTVMKIHADPNNTQVQEAFPNGMPTQLSACLCGQRIYDPRKDSTSGGSGSHRKDDPTTWQYLVSGVTIGQNPALQLRDYLVRPKSEGGGGRDPACIPDDYLAAAATACDAALTVPNGTGGTTTIPTYRSSIGLSTGDSVPTNIQKLLDAMGGWMIETAGELRIFAGAYVAPTTTIDEDWVVGTPTFQTTAERDNRWNTVDCTFTDPASGFIPVQTPSYHVTGSLTADGGDLLAKHLSIPAANNQYRAQYLTIISARQSRNMRLLTLPLNLRGMDLDEGEVVAVDLTEYGMSGDTFMVLTWKRQSDSSVLTTLLEMAPTTFDNATMVPTAGQGLPPLTDHAPPTPTGLVAKPKVNAIALDWDDLPNYVFSTYWVYRATAVGGPYTHIKTTTTSSWEDSSVAAKTTYYYKVAARSYLGKSSALSSSVNSLAITVTDVVGGTGPNLMPSKYCVFTTNANKLPPFGLHTSLSFGKAASTAKYGYLCLQLTSTSSSVPPKLALVGNTANANIALDNKVYSVQVWLDALSNLNWYNLTFRFYNAGGGAACAAVAATLVPHTGAPIGVYTAQLDLTAASNTDVYLEVEWTSAITSGNTLNVQGFAIFEMQGTSVVTPDFAAAPAASADDLPDGPVMGTVMQAAFADATNQLDLSRSAQDGGTGVEGIVNASTSFLTDGAGLANQADLLQIRNLPPDVATAAAAGLMADAQASIGVASAVKEVLRSDGAAPYWDPQYHGESDGTGLMGSAFMPAGTYSMTSTMTTIGQTLVIPNPGGFISLLVIGQCGISSSAASDRGAAQIILSSDGGATFSTISLTASGQVINAGVAFNFYPLVPIGAWSGTPTGDIWIEMQVNSNLNTGPVNINPTHAGLMYFILASANGIGVSTNPLGVTIPSTATMSCSKNYPGTTCQASKNITWTPSGGKPGYTGAAAKTAGTGTVSGSSSNPFTVSDTETTADGGATSTTTVNVKVTDTQTYTMTPASESGTTVTGTLNVAGLIPVSGKFDVTVGVPAGYNGSARTALSGTTGTTVKYTSGTSGMGALSTPATINNVNVTSSSCVITATFTRTYPSVTVAINGSKSGVCQAPSGSCTVTLNLTNAPAGGDLSYTRSNTKTAGGFTVGGSTSTNFTCSQTDTVAGSPTDTGTVHCQATDGHSNVGSSSAGLSFTFNNNS